MINKLDSLSGLLKDTVWSSLGEIISKIRIVSKAATTGSVLFHSWTLWFSCPRDFKQGLYAHPNVSVKSSLAL